MSAAYLFPKMFTGFYNQKIYQFSCFKATHEISVLRNYNANVSGRRSSFYHCSIQEVKLCKNLVGGTEF